MNSNQNIKPSEEEPEECPELTSEANSDSDSWETTSLSSIEFNEDVDQSLQEEKRWVLTTKKAMVGDIIEDNCLPITKTIEQIFKDHCSHCMKKPEQPKKCSKCHQIYYCDKNCQRMDWKYHKNECKVFGHKNFIPQQCLSTERLLIRLWLTIESDPNFVIEKHRLFDGSEICIKDIEINSKELSADIDRMVEFRMICEHFKSYEMKFNRKELLHYYGFVVFNSMRHSLFHYHYDLTRNAIGIGVFLETYSLKHSCNPNTAYINTGFGLQIRAIKAIESNEEITISYLDLAKDKTERMATLKTFFYIDCKCDKCQQNLDSDIDYKQFSSDLQQIYSISNYGEILGDSYLSTVDTKQSYAMFSKMTELYSRIYGPYHPNKTGFLLQQLLGMWRLSKCKSNRTKRSTNKAVLKELYDICDTNLKVTYGVDHYFYSQFRKFKIF